MPAPYPYQTVAEHPSGISVYRNIESGRYAVTDADNRGFYWTQDEADALDFAAQVDARFHQNRRDMVWQFPLVVATALFPLIVLAWT